VKTRSRFDRWLEDWGGLEGSLPVYRVLLGLAILVIVLPRHPWLVYAPESLLYPPAGLPYLFPHPPGAWAVFAVNALLVGAAVLFVLGVRWRLTGFLLTALLLLLNSWAYAYGKVNHDILVVLAPAVLALGTTPDRAPRAARPGPGYAAPLLALIVALAMFSAAVPKVLSGWLAYDHSATHFHFLRLFHFAENAAPLAPWFLPVTTRWFWEPLDVMTVAIESAFLVALVSPRAFRLVCALATGFHLGIALLMDIAFTSNVIVYGAFARWDLVGARLGAVWPGLGGLTARLRRAAEAVRGRPAATVFLAAVVAAWWVGLGNPIRELQREAFGEVYTEEALLAAAALLAVAYLVSFSRRRSHVA